VRRAADARAVQLQGLRQLVLLVNLNLQTPFNAR
jgi:hypothetical protein